jgi:abequosyltransferase
MQTNPREANRPLLTIAIPTCNRSEYLRQLLDSLRDELRNQPKVRLLISDNASTDDTAETVKAEQLRGTQVDYIRNTTNVGPDANFLQCYEQSISKYVWIFSDDDVLRPGTVGRVLEYLSGDEYELVFLAPRGFSKDLALTRPGPSGKAPIECKDAAQFLRRVHIFTTLISCNIIKKDRVEAIEHRPFAELVGSCLMQLGWTYTALRAHRKSLFIGDELVCYRLGNTGGYGVCRVFGPTLAGITEQWLATPRLNEIVLNASLQRLLPPFLLVANKKVRGNYLEEDPHALLSSTFGHKFRYWIFAYPLLVLPARLAWLWLQFIRVINRVDRAFGYPSLSWQQGGKRPQEPTQLTSSRL